MNKLTIQINNLEALERLIGGDSEVEVDIRNSVVQKFAEKHLKPLAKSTEITTTLADIQNDIAKQVSEKCEKEIATFKRDWNGRLTDIKLNSAIQSEIDRQVRVMTDDKIRLTVDAAIKFWTEDVELKKRIDNRFEYYTNDLISTEIKKRIEKLKSTL